MAIERIKPAFHFEAERLEQLRQIAPEAFADGKINWDTLQEALGKYLEEEDMTAEHFGLFWPGKRAARKIASIPSEGTLIPCPGEGINEDNTSNIFIEGENLEVLKLLQKSYANRIKLIYIDPPYNTGKDFIYEDNFTESIDEYLKRTGQLDEESQPISANTKSDGRFHSKWLSMMYPRLRLARNLLTNDGLIILSIDNNEISNLKLLMNEVFGEENFVDALVWQKRKGGGNDSTFIATDHEYVLIYTKFKDEHSKWRVPYEEEYLKRYKESDNKGMFYWDTLTRNGLQNPIIYDIKCPDGSIIRKGKWQMAETTFYKKLEEKEIRFTKNDDGKWSVHYKVRQPEGRVFRSIISNVVNGDSAKEFEELFGEKKIFDNPKPTELIKQLLLLDIKDDAIVLDFFAGSSTTAHAVLELNKTLNKNLRFIQVQIKEEITDKTDAGATALRLGYTDIFELSKARLTKAIKKYKFKNGFRVLKLYYSNFKKWRSYSGTNINELVSLFEGSTTPLVDDWESQNLLTEILLIEGYPLDSKLEILDQFKKNEVTMVTSDFCEHKLLVCLDKKVYADTIKNLQLNEDDVFICLDSAITDQDKVTLQDKGLIKTI